MVMVRLIHMHHVAGVDSAKRYTLKHRLGPSITYIESDEFSENGWEEVRLVLHVCMLIHAVDQLKAACILHRNQAQVTDGHGHRYFIM